jgi:hypothetical protein
MIAYADNCQCKNPPEDDGDTTCWVHHRCSDGMCTHTDGDDEPERELDCEE